MRNPSWKDKVRYWFDNLMSKGPLSLIVLLAAITFVVIAIAGIIVALLPEVEGAGVLSSMWLSLMHAIDAGTIAGDSGGFLFMLVMSVVTLCGLFITSMLIGVIGAGLVLRRYRLLIPCTADHTIRQTDHQPIYQRNIHTILFSFSRQQHPILYPPTG